MTNKYKIIGLMLLFVAAVVVFALLLHGHTIAILSPRGVIADHERRLIIITVLLSLIVVIPVFALTAGIVWKFRATNVAARYTPDWDHSRTLETIWWGLPTAIIVVLAVIAWKSSHELDPFKPIASNVSPITVQVVALDWKWLFIYPQQNIATVNYLEFPERRPINFEITGDAPMNSFWIPQLGGQIYAMAGMTTHLSLMADGTGSYSGSSANISGRGFAGMRFVVKSTTDQEFNQWVAAAKRSPQALTLSSYNQLAKPSENNAPTYYGAADRALYDAVVMKYMMPASGALAGVQ